MAAQALHARSLLDIGLAAGCLSIVAWVLLIAACAKLLSLVISTSMSSASSSEEWLFFGCLANRPFDGNLVGFKQRLHVLATQLVWVRMGL